jgi:hypothetical protein
MGYGGTEIDGFTYGDASWQTCRRAVSHQKKGNDRTTTSFKLAATTTEAGRKTC